jgi:protein involved in polysaccharide export with SLBB domain
MRLTIFITLLLFALSVGAYAQADTPVYRLQVGDQVRLSVWGESGLTVTTEVLSDGTLNFPLVGRLRVVGMSLSELEAECTSLLKTYLVNPIVSVMITSPHLPRVKVLGKVRDPGKFNIQYGDTLLDAVAYAGGFDERCDIGRIVILNKNYAKFVDLKSFLRGEELQSDMVIDIAINDGDLVFVPEVGRPDWAKATSYISGIVQSLIVVTTR